MRFLILGCNGMAGHMISLYLKEQGHDVIGYARQPSKFVKTVVGDATDFELLKSIVQKGRFDSVINCVGLLNQFAEKDHPMAVMLNGYLPHFLAKITEEMDTQVIHMSTDCVFSGNKGGYTESSLRDGESFYDRSKALGEIVDQKNITLRNSIVGPDIKQNGIGLLNWFLQQKESVKGFTGAIWTGQTTLQLAKTMEEAAKVKASGLINAVPPESISKFDLLMLFNQEIRRKPICITKDDSVVTDKTLIRTNYSGFKYEIPGYGVMVRELGEWMRDHRDIYPHYDL